MLLTRINEPFIFTVFGASGDLAKLKIFPALYELAFQNRFPEDFYVYGFSRTKKTHEEFRKDFEESVRAKFGEETNEEALSKILNHVFYFTGQYTEQESYEKFFEELNGKHPTKSTPFIAYYSTPPKVFNHISRNLAPHKDAFAMRLVIEKPFGDNEQSAREMFAILEEHYDEDQIYLLDHYLGKESVQSILSMRYNNSIINHLLKGELIKYIQITGIENFGIKERGRYFDEVGIIKDMVQSHLLQLLALVTMSMPNTLNASSIHREKYNILSALEFDKENFLALGQYESYKNENDIAPDSQTETFATFRLWIDQTEWAHAPIYIRTGKKTETRHTYITVAFKKLPFQENIPELKHNKLMIELQPNGNVYFKISNKRGGTYQEFHQMAPGESLACFGDDCLPEHGRLLLDVLKGERMHFLSFNEVIACWHFIDRILKEKELKNLPLEIYEDNCDGPQNQFEMIEKEDRKWHEI